MSVKAAKRCITMSYVSTC